MSELAEAEADARSLGLALLDASRIYEDFLIRRYEGRLRRRRVSPHRSAIIGLVGRQRRFMRAAYTLADAGQVLEAIGPTRSMFEFLVCQRWLARDPDRNWKLWMREDHAARDLMRNRLREHAPALYAAADASLSAEQRDEAAVIADVRTRVAAELGDRQPEDRRGLEQRAALVGLGFVYDVLYRYGSSVAVHPTLLSVDLLYEKGRKGLVLRGEPTAQLGAPPVYLYCAQFLYEALGDGAAQSPALRLSELPLFGRELGVLAERYAGARSPNWPDLLPSD
jgi:Family of unknown function (DUF5677)